MNTRNAFAALTLLTIAAGATACNKAKKEDVAPTATSDQSSAANPSTAAATSATATKHKVVTAASFAADAVEAFCGSITQCKNEELRQYLQSRAIYKLAFSSLPKSELDKSKPTLEKMRAEKRTFMNHDECVTVGNLMMAAGGFNQLADSSNSTITFNAGKAATCIEALGASHGTCEKDVKRATSLSNGEISKLEKIYQPALRTDYPSCLEAVSGSIEPIKKCTFDIECNGKAVKCQKGQCEIQDSVD